MKSPLHLIVLIAAAAFIFQGSAARAQTGTFTIITGPGTGAMLNATGGVVNGPGVGTNGILIPPNGGCPGTQFHYHGLLMGAADPFPGGCGWGQINFPMLPGPTIGLPATVPSVPLQLIPATETAVRLTPTNVPTTAAGSIAVKYDPTLAAFAPPPERRTLPVAALWSPSVQQIVAEDDAHHAARYSPRPTTRLVLAREQRTAPRLTVPRTITPRITPPRAPHLPITKPDESAWPFEMTGPQAKPAP